MTMFIFFAWVIWVAFLVFILVDNFRRTDHSGWAKAGWTLLLIFVPLIGALIYMIARPNVPSGAPVGQPMIGHTANMHVVAAQLQASKPIEWNDPSTRTHAVFEIPPMPVDGPPMMATLAKFSIRIGG